MPDREATGEGPHTSACMSSRGALVEISSYVLVDGRFALHSSQTAHGALGSLMGAIPRTASPWDMRFTMSWPVCASLWCQRRSEPALATPGLGLVLVCCVAAAFTVVLSVQSGESVTGLAFTTKSRSRHWNARPSLPCASYVCRRFASPVQVVPA